MRSTASKCATSPGLFHRTHTHMIKIGTHFTRVRRHLPVCAVRMSVLLQLRCVCAMLSVQGPCAAGAHLQGKAAACNAGHPEVRPGASAGSERQPRPAPDARQGRQPLRCPPVLLMPFAFLLNSGSHHLCSVSSTHCPVVVECSMHSMCGSG